MEILIGREKQCDYVILDPRNRVSRRHAVLSRSGEHLYIQDMSTNGTYVNGKKILKFQKVRIKITDSVTLSTDYVLNLQEALRPHVVSNSQSSDERTVIFQNEKVTYNSGNKSVSFDPEKTSLSDLLDLDDTQFSIADVIIGNLDESGYLNRTVFALVDDLAFSANIYV